MLRTFKETGVDKLNLRVFYGPRRIRICRPNPIMCIFHTRASEQPDFDKLGSVPLRTI